MRDRRGLLGVPGPNPSRPPPHPLPIFPPAASPLVGSSSLRPLHPAAGSVDPSAGIRATETGPAPRLCPWSLTRSGLVLGVLGGGAASPGKPRSPRPDPQSSPPAPQAQRGPAQKTKERCAGEGRRGARRQTAQTLAKSLEIPKRLWKVSGRRCKLQSQPRPSCFVSVPCPCAPRGARTLGQLCSGDPVPGGPGGLPPRGRICPSRGDVPSNRTLAMSQAPK